jgi:hypothetical protein
MRRLGFACAIGLALLPLAVRADGVDFTVPDHYLVTAPGSDAARPAVYRIWGRSLDGVRHSIVVSATPSGDDVGHLVDAMAAYVNGRHAIDVERSDAAPLCGAPSVQFTYAYANQLTYVFRHVKVGGRLLVVSYAHPVGTAADPAALAALDTLCSGVHQPAGPKGWTIEAPFPPNASAWRLAPGSPSLIAQSVRPAAANHDADSNPYEGIGATIISDRRETCGTTTIHRVTATLEGGRTQEFAGGTLRGFDYIVAYVRPPSAPPDPAAMETLTSFCTETAPH